MATHLYLKIAVLLSVYVRLVIPLLLIVFCIGCPLTFGLVYLAVLIKRWCWFDLQEDFATRVQRPRRVKKHPPQSLEIQPRNTHQKAKKHPTTISEMITTQG